MPKRVKTELLTSQKNFEKAINTIVELNNKIDKLEAERDKEINSIRDQYNSDIETCQRNAQQLLLQTELYARDQRDSLLKDNKSSTTSLGIYGFRMTPPAIKTLKGFSWVKVLESLKKNKKYNAFIKTTETVDKEKLKKELDDKALSDLGCHKERKEEFFVRSKQSIDSNQ